MECALDPKLGLDWCRSLGLCAAQEKHMDDDTIDLVRQLLCRAGMALEDVCDTAIASPEDREGLSDVVGKLAVAQRG